MRHRLPCALVACMLLIPALPAQTSSSQPIQTLAEALAQRAAAKTGVASGTVSAQRAVPIAAEAAVTPAQTVEDALREFTMEAAVIFAGEVVEIKRLDGAVEIRWHIEEAVRGVVGGEYVQREWAGLWVDGDRYTVGQRSLVLLHAPSVAGFSSPVRGLDGVMPLKGDAGTGTVDLRWLMTHVLRGEALAGGGVRSVSTMRAMMQRSVAVSDKTSFGLARANAVGVQGTEVDEAVSSAQEGSAERATVLALMKAWSARGVQQ